MRIPLGAMVVASLASPALAATGARPHITLGSMFGNAVLPMKLVMLGLVGSTIAILIIGAVKLMRSPPDGGSAFISGMRIGGPAAGLLGAAYGGLNAMVGVVMSGRSDFVLVPLLPAGFCLVLGLLAGVVGIMAHTMMNARLDRALLKA